MKPDWKDAPKWAKWLAQNDDGQWYWFENKPTYGQLKTAYRGSNGGGHIHDGWIRNFDYDKGHWVGKMQMCIDYSTMIERRPKEVT